MNDWQTDTPRENILIVDDDPDVLRVLSYMLTDEGYGAQTAISGAAALTAVEAKVPDLILLDIMMPEMNGFQVCEQLKADAATRDIPIIFISAIDATQDKVRAFTAGGVDYVTKPFQLKEVLARVTTHLSLRALQRALQSARDELASQLEELRARNEELDAFARTVARDLKAPLTSMIGHADTLDKLYGKLSEEDLHEFLNAIIASGHKMDEILDELLLLAGVRQTKQVEIKPLDMAKIVNTALERLSDKIEEYQAQIILPSGWPPAVGYGPWVEEVWVSYINNALKYGGRPPHVKLGAGPEAEGIVCFWVRDNGPRLAPEEQSRVFAPLEGRGLGLVIVKRIMERLGRRVGVESARGRGNTFSFTLRAG